MNIAIPKRGRGRSSKAAQERYNAQAAEFCEQILEIRSRLDFEVSVRGWCYALEELAGLNKNDFDQAEKIINDCRKDGRLPLDICAVDETRKFECVEETDDQSPEEHLEQAIDLIRNHWHSTYTPFSFWNSQDYYVQMVVEKIDLKSLFRGICKQYRVPIANGKGWSDLHMRADMIERFQYWSDRGKQCVLLYCGDFDPIGLRISRDIANNMESIRALDFDASDLIVDRFGLNFEFIEEQELTWIDNLKTGRQKKPNDLSDPKHPNHNDPDVQEYIATYGVRKVEANALVVRPEAGRELCLQALLNYIDLDAMAEYEEAIEAERGKFLTLVNERLG